MARRAGGGVGAATWAAIFFGITTIVATILAIVAYSDIEKERADRQVAQDIVRKWVSDAERNNDDFWRESEGAKKAGKSKKARKAKIEKRLDAVKKKSEELKGLAKTISGLKSKHDAVISRQGSQMAKLATQLKKKKKKR